MSKHTYFRVKEFYPGCLNLLINHVMEIQESTSNKVCIVAERKQNEFSELFGGRGEQAVKLISL